MNSHLGSEKSRGSHGTSFHKCSKGLLLVLASQCLSILINTTARFLVAGASNVHPFQLLNVRMLITLVLCGAYQLYRWNDDVFPGPKPIRGLLMIRSAGGILGAVGFYRKTTFSPSYTCY